MGISESTRGEGSEASAARERSDVGLEARWPDLDGIAARAVGVWKVYGSGESEVVALRDVNVEIATGRFTAIMGASGSGKSTLMHCLAGLDETTRGEVFVGDTKLTGLSDSKLTRLRRDRVGFVFQQFNLLPTLTAEENIRLPLDIAGRRPDAEWLATIVKTMRLEDRLGHRPAHLSGGEQQRVACARALVDPTRRHLRRRADRQPRLALKHGDPRLPPRLGSRPWTDDRDGHPRPEGCLVRRPGAVPLGRPHRRGDPATDHRADPGSAQAS